jgi:hypothetical protein
MTGLSTLLMAAEPTAGLKSGDSLAAFTVSKVGGAEDDGVSVGDKLCYRCKFQSRPMVLIFSRTEGDGLAKLSQSVDAALSKHSEKQLRGLVSMMAEDQKAATAAAKNLVASAKPKHLAVAVPADVQEGPKDYRIDPKSDITIVLGNESTVFRTFTFSKDKIDHNVVLKSIEEMLKQG